MTENYYLITSLEDIFVDGGVEENTNLYGA